MMLALSIGFSQAQCIEGIYIGDSLKFYYPLSQSDDLPSDSAYMRIRGLTTEGHEYLFEVDSLTYSQETFYHVYSVANKVNIKEYHKKGLLVIYLYDGDTLFSRCDVRNLYSTLSIEEDFQEENVTIVEEFYATLLGQRTEKGQGVHFIRYSNGLVVRKIILQQ